jgi:hypothetical protein
MRDARHDVVELKLQFEALWRMGALAISEQELALRRFQA